MSKCILLKPSPSLSGTPHTQFAEGLHFSAFHYNYGEYSGTSEQGTLWVFMIIHVYSSIYTHSNVTKKISNVYDVK